MHTQHCGCQHWLNTKNQYHRLDGPAIDRTNCKSGGTTGVSYYLHGQPLTKENHAKKIEMIKEDALEEIGDKLLRCYCHVMVQKQEYYAPTRDKLRNLFLTWRLIGGGWDPDVSEAVRFNMVERGVALPRKGN